MVRVTVENGPDKGKSFTLADGEHLVGRSPHATCRLSADHDVSREHCAIRVDGDRAFVTNRSRFGTILVGHGPVLEPAALTEDACLQLAHSATRLLVRRVSAEAGSEGTSVRVTVESGPDKGKSFTLADGEHLVGRSPHATCRLSPADQHVSRKHCVIRVTGGQVFAVNRSKFGTILVGRGPIQEPVALTDGACLQLARSTTCLRIQGVPTDCPSSEPKSVWMDTEQFRQQFHAPEADDPPTREDADAVENLYHREMRKHGLARALVWAILALAFAVGAALIWFCL